MSLRVVPVVALALLALVLAPLVPDVLGDGSGERRGRDGDGRGARSAAQPLRHHAVDAAHRGRAFEARYRAAVRSLPVAREVRDGYDRDAFTHWISQGDGCDTRDRVLVAEARRRPDVDADCDLTGGRWRSPYDGFTTTDPSDLDVDHAVPLAEAWDSGARRWTDATRERYANDLRDPRTLVAVSAASNRSKGDQDPAERLPPDRACAYVVHWVAVKVRWRLSVDRAERRLLQRRARTCGNPVVRVVRARVR